MLISPLVAPRCEKNHPNSGLIICKYNTKHRYLPKDMPEHLVRKNIVEMSLENDSPLKS